MVEGGWLACLPFSQKLGNLRVRQDSHSLVQSLPPYPVHLLVAARRAEGHLQNNVQDVTEARIRRLEEN